MDLTIIAVVNAIVWTGIISFLLLRMMGNHQQIEGQIERLEREITEKESKAR